MKKVVVKVAVQDEKDKQKAMRAVSSLSGIESLAMELKDQKLTLTGDIDPVDVVAKLRKNWHTEIVSVGAPEEKKPEEVKKENPEKDDAKKAVDNEKKKEKTEAEQIADLIRASKSYYPCYPCMSQPVYYYVTQPENPNTCVIC
uniref:HMA domain-containing protein n=2 Tax=Kalanchoe fedtschenkoi TaxID=63787 RepID=A0A7N0U277_KALFE